MQLTNYQNLIMIVTQKLSKFNFDSNTKKTKKERIDFMSNDLFIDYRNKLRDINPRLYRYTEELRRYKGLEMSVIIAKNKKHDLSNMELISELMSEMGFMLTLKDDKLTIKVDNEKLLRPRRAKAGRNKVHTEYMYSDIVFMMQTMNDEEIAKEVGISTSTYYRRKRELKASLYYHSLDPERLDDRKYLESVNGNKKF